MEGIVSRELKRFWALRWWWKVVLVFAAIGVVGAPVPGCSCGPERERALQCKHS